MSIDSAITIKCPPTILEMQAARRRISSSPHFFSFQQPLLRRKFCSYSPKMSTRQLIEHIVLFKIKPETDPTKLNSMLTNLNNLASLPTVLHISAGPLLRHRGPDTLSFTHMLHSRYSSKTDLDSYSIHPSHIAVVTDYVKPIISDVMAVDWVADDVDAPVALPPGSALRVTFTKLKEDVGEDGKEKVLGVIGGVKDKFPGIRQLTLGENFSPERSKGFSIASIAVFKGVSELEALENESEKANKEKDKVRDLLDGVLVLDYVVPASQTPSL